MCRFSPLFLAIALASVISFVSPLARCQTSQPSPHQPATPLKSQGQVPATACPPSYLSTNTTDAETAYYQAQTIKICHDLSPSAEIAQNLNVVIPFATGILGLIVAAFTAWLNFKLTRSIQSENSQLTKKAQEEARRARRASEFHEACARLGDKDSPAVRAGAATTIAQMISETHPESNDPSEPDYLKSAIRQLQFAASLETDRVVHWSIYLGMRTLTRRDPKSVLEGFHQDRQWLIVDLINTMNAVLLYNGSSLEQADRQSDTGKLVLESWGRTVGLTTELFEHLLAGPTISLRSIAQEKQYISSLPPDVRVKNKEDSQTEIWAIGRKMQTSARVIEYALYALSGLRIALSSIDMRPQYEKISPIQPFTPHNGLNLQKLFLPEVDLRYTDLHDSDLSEAVLANVNLTKANLTKANLRKSILANANLENSTVVDAKVAGAKMQGVKLGGAKWWLMDFRISDDGPEIDLELLDYLYRRFAAGIPDDLTGAGLQENSAVAQYVLKARRLGQTASARAESNSHA